MARDPACNPMNVSALHQLETKFSTSSAKHIGHGELPLERRPFREGMSQLQPCASGFAGSRAINDNAINNVRGFPSSRRPLKAFRPRTSEN